MQTLLRTTITTLLAAGAICLVTGCAGVTRITSDPTGATISFNGSYIGESPLAYSLEPGIHKGWPANTYEFTAEKDGYRGETKIVKERMFQCPRDSLPPQIHFDLKPMRDDR